ncbi:isochorismatase family protein [Aerococcus sp. Group 1]|uniref:cysteine hydrolase family protein n=1 Tax=Aerococcus urinae (strain CCUG 59500 / ACS-120-V-Col10a) TaxID=2976812 RepID=UPI000200FB85|nr:isochorismatase family cysteine hydrolase [Aerococcus sp. Group 1]AEA01258.1 isochorismatase family protein [Aerococcus sp. Group 1]
MKRALINVDYTNDFVASDGSLTCGEPTQAIEGAISRLSEEFIQAGDFLVFAIDAHHKGDPYHPETKLFPPHNIVGSHGQDLYGQLAQVYDDNKENSQVYYMPKTRYSAFAGTDLLIKLRERHIEELHIVGVCTDICVLHTAIDAYNLGFKIVIHKDCVASFNPQGHEWALNHFKTCLNAEVI